MEIVGSFDKDTLFCTGSFSKLLTTYVSLSFLAEKFNLNDILDDDHFFERICVNEQAKKFLTLFQTKIGNPFSLRDICSYYAGLPYTFDVSPREIEQVELGKPFKHHSIMDEKTFWDMCQNNMAPVYTNRCKFHYSEVSIIFLGYLIEKAFNVAYDELYQKFVIDSFHLQSSLFSRKLPPHVLCKDLSDKYDYPSIAILDHGYFCYSNGFYTTLNDMKKLLDKLLFEPIFVNYMVDVSKARAASPRIMNGLTVEIRRVDDDLIYGYEGLSFSGCNIWAYSTKQKRGFITFTDDEEAAYQIYDLLGYSDFSKVPEHTEEIYKNFIKNYHDPIELRETPLDFQGKYQRVRINEKELETHFAVDKHSMIIRNPEEIQYDIIYVGKNFRVRGKDKVHGAKVGFAQAKSGNRYFYYDGTLYKKLSI